GAIGSGRPCLRGTCGTQDCFSISLVTQVRRFFFTASPGILLVSLACARWRVRPEGRCVVLESCRFLRTRWITNS
ncbi:hypothetical protein PC113_g24770, partial [Phytophthora cactorum]